ncbi:MAG: nuclear transport factor 2 family protein [Alphaproteobacteria bacterium]|nr:nuclear transport factor 2 family protein [Alphaproteobacteria bacterium]
MGAGNKDVVRRVIRAYVEGDFEPLMQAVSDDIVWNSNAPAAHYRFGGSFQGRIGLKEGLSLVATEFGILRYDIRELTEEGAVVWALSDLEIVEHRTGRHAKVNLANRWQFAEGKIASCTEFFDSAGVLSELGRPLKATA